MILSHITKESSLISILSKGLQCNKMGIIYFSPKLNGWRKLQKDEVLLHVKIENQKFNCI